MTFDVSLSPSPFPAVIVVDDDASVRDALTDYLNRHKFEARAIADRGPGLGDELAARAFEPFYRGESSRNRDTGGTGLGLTIARDLVKADDGPLDLAARPGGGTVATIRYAQAPMDEDGIVTAGQAPAWR